MDPQIPPLPEPTPQEIKEIRKRVFFFGIIASLVLVAGWGVATYFAKLNYEKVTAEAQKAQQEIEVLKQNRASSPSTSSGQFSVPENWQTYRNEEYGFEFKYPGEWSIEEGHNDYSEPSVLVRVKERDFDSFRFLILPHGGYDYGPPLDPEPIVSSIKINSHNAQTTTWQLENERELKWIHFDSVPSSWKSDWNRIDINVPGDLKPITDQILSTFKFVE